MKKLKKLTFMLIVMASVQLTVRAAWGDPDPSFGINGKYQTSQTGWFPQGLNIRTDGTIYVTGFYIIPQTGARRLLLRRYFPNGTPDNAFGTVTDPTDGSEGAHVEVLSSGKIVVAGLAFDHCKIWRFNSNGSPDTNFGSGTGSIEIFSVGRCTSLVVKNGKLTVAGLRYPPPAGGDILFRVNDDGTPDTLFGTNGQVDTTIFAIWDVIIDPSNRIVIGGSAASAWPQGAPLWNRLTDSGTDDPAFVSSTTNPTPQCSYVGHIARQGSGRLLTYCAGGNPAIAYLRRFTSDGVHDGTDIANPGLARFLGIQKDKSVVIGTHNAFYRYSDALAATDSFTLSAEQQGLVSNGGATGMQWNGKVILAGRVNNGRFTLYRTLED